MKKILCFGDSNTFGFNPIDGSRYKPDERWSGILKEKLKNKFEVIEKGCNNRTCFTENPAGIEQTGYKILPKILKNHFDFFIIALGINDTQFLFNPQIQEFETGIKNLINIIRSQNKEAKILILSPNIIDECILKSYFSVQFDKNSIEKSKELSKIYYKVAKEKNCDFLDLNKIAKVSKIDGLHYNIEEHKKIADKLEKYFLN